MKRAESLESRAYRAKLSMRLVTLGTAVLCAAVALFVAARILEHFARR